MFIGIHSENVADELPARPEDLLTDGADVSQVSNVLILYFHRPIDLYKPSQMSSLVASLLVIRHLSQL